MTRSELALLTLLILAVALTVGVFLGVTIHHFATHTLDELRIPLEAGA